MSAPTGAFEERLRRLARRLESPLPGEAAHARLSVSDRPLLRMEAVLRRPSLRHAAVLVALFPGHDEEAHTVLTLRRPDLRDHAGQVSFPGGRMEEGESAEEAALREGFEELAIPPAAVSVLGRLSPLWIPPSDFLVYPVVGSLAQRPDWVIQDAEVSAVIELPVVDLAGEGQPGREWRDLRGERREVPFYAVAGHQVWGATAMILSELAELWEG